MLESEYHLRKIVSYRLLHIVSQDVSSGTFSIPFLQAIRDGNHKITANKLVDTFVFEYVFVF